MSIQGKRLVRDAVLIAVLLVTALAAFIIINALRRPGAEVVISVNGDAVSLYSLSDDGEYPLNGGTNLLVIEGGEAYIKSADCPDGLCVHQGKISDVGERIVCLPNRVMVEVVSDGGGRSRG